ncbi:MAG: RNA polymerase sigma-70 factor [Bacteroides sp.]|nr:RNA polymerase sigma-70 factor [Bacteroides sp.]
MLNELILLTKIREGDIKAFEEVFRRYYSSLCWYAAGITGTMESAEEIVEELFYVLWKNRERLQIFQSVKSYLYRSVRNEAVQYCEHREVRERYRNSVQAAGQEQGETSDPHRQLEYKELQTLIRHTLDKLPDRRRRIFKMHRMQGMKYTEIALSLSLSVKTVEAEMTKVLRTLRNEIDNYIQIK